MELWEFKYAPTTLGEMIVNKDIRPKLEKAIYELPNIMLYGTHGIGKGTFTNILLKATELDKNGSMWINASDETGVDTMREKIRPFATSLGFTPLKVVVLNEGDSLSAGPQGAQKMMRQLMEDVQKNCRFILLCNYEHLIIPELKSRFRVIKLDNPPAPEIFKLAVKILKAEKVKFKKEIVVSIIKKCYPDIRKTIGVLQENTINGVLTGDLISQSEGIFRDILDKIKGQDVEGVRKTLRSNYIPYSELYKYLYDNVEEFKQPGMAILSIGEHLYRNTTIAIKEVNFMRMMIEMLNVGMV